MMVEIQVWREVLRVVAPAIRKGEKPRRYARLRRCAHEVELPFFDPEPDDVRCPACSAAATTAARDGAFDVVTD